MKPIRLALPLVAIAFAATALLYNVHPTRSSDHQDSFTVGSRPGADITDMYVFPSPSNGNNVVLAMNVSPLIMPGQGTATFFDPAVMYQIKIAHGPALGNTNAEDTVIQFAVNGSDQNQVLTTYFGAPAQTGTSNSFNTANQIGQVRYNTSTTLSNGVQVFAGPRSDPFFIDLLQFFKIVPDRFIKNQPNPPPPSATSFNGFPAGSGCSTAPATDFLGSNNFNVLSLVVEVPKNLLQNSGSNGSMMHTWGTTSTVSGS